MILKLKKKWGDDITVHRDAFGSYITISRDPVFPELLDMCTINYEVENESISVPQTLQKQHQTDEK